jgi:hypothetical protein
MLLSYGTVGGQAMGGQLVHWSGTGWNLAAGDRGRVSFRAGTGVVVMTLDRSLLRDRGFNWRAFSFQAGRGRGVDSVPNGGAHPYSPGPGGQGRTNGDRKTIRSSEGSSTTASCAALPTA